MTHTHTHALQTRTAHTPVQHNHSDPAVKQIIINMHETERPIVIEDLDDEHLLVRADAVEGLEARLEEEVGVSPVGLCTSLTLCCCIQLERHTFTLE